MLRWSTSAPCWRQISRSRSLPARLAAIWARRSPTRSCGVREFMRIVRKSPSSIRPRVTSRATGNRSPSWKMLVESPDSLPGTRPPTSAWCAVLATKPMSSPSAKTGAMMAMSFR